MRMWQDRGGDVQMKHVRYYLWWIDPMSGNTEHDVLDICPQFGHYLFTFQNLTLPLRCFLKMQAVDEIGDDE